MLGPSAAPIALKLKINLSKLGGSARQLAWYLRLQLQKRSLPGANVATRRPPAQACAGRRKRTHSALAQLCGISPQSRDGSSTRRGAPCGKAGVHRNLWLRYFHNRARHRWTSRQSPAGVLHGIGNSMGDIAVNVMQVARKHLFHLRATSRINQNALTSTRPSSADTDTHAQT
jgi:hypothetical protein